MSYFYTNKVISIHVADSIPDSFVTKPCELCCLFADMIIFIDIKVHASFWISNPQYSSHFKNRHLLVTVYAKDDQLLNNHN